MSKIFGPVVQQGYVVPDMQKALAHWVARGVGPFYLQEDIRLPSEHYGDRQESHIQAAFAYSGDQQIELISPYEDCGETIYGDYLKENPEGGLQHLAVWVDDVDAKLEALKQSGLNYVVAHRYIDSHAYLDLPDSPGVMIQLMPADDIHIRMFDVIKKGAEDWDGKTEPVRAADWS
ncbi:MAG: VOC family protein [Alphaproteobacteria bacterium]